MKLISRRGTWSRINAKPRTLPSCKPEFASTDLLLQGILQQLAKPLLSLLLDTYVETYSYEELSSKMIASRSIATPARQCLRRAYAPQWIPALTQVLRDWRLELKTSWLTI